MDSCPFGSKLQLDIRCVDGFRFDSKVDGIASPEVKLIDAGGECREGRSHCARLDRVLPLWENGAEASLCRVLSCGGDLSGLSINEPHGFADAAVDDSQDHCGPT